MLLLESLRDYPEANKGGDWKADATASKSGTTSASANADGQ